MWQHKILVGRNVWTLSVSGYELAQAHHIRETDDYNVFWPGADSGFDVWTFPDVVTMKAVIRRRVASYLAQMLAD